MGEPAEAPFTDGPTVRVPAVPALSGVPAFTAVPPQAIRQPGDRPHRALAGELAALAFSLPPGAIPAQRGPSEL